MIRVSAMMDPKIKDRLQWGDEATPVYSAGLELLVLLVCDAPRTGEVRLVWETPVARDAPEVTLVAVLLV
jgi:hypothetical protein